MLASCTLAIHSPSSKVPYIRTLYNTFARQHNISIPSDTETVDLEFYPNAELEDEYDQSMKDEGDEDLSPGKQKTAKTRRAKAAAEADAIKIAAAATNEPESAEVPVPIEVNPKFDFRLSARPAGATYERAPIFSPSKKKKAASRPIQKPAAKFVLKPAKGTSALDVAVRFIGDDAEEIYRLFFTRVGP